MLWINISSFRLWVLWINISSFRLWALLFNESSFRLWVRWFDMRSFRLRVLWFNTRWLWSWYLCQNPREASSRPRIFFNSLVYVFVCLFTYLFVSCLLAKRKTIQTWNLAHILPLTLSKKRDFYQITVTAASLEKLPCHVDIPHNISIAL